MEVLDDDGNVRTSKEAVSVWCDHFLRLLGGPAESLNDSCCAEKDPKSDFNDCLCSSVTHEEVLWALTKVKKDAAPGSDGVEV